MTTSTVSNVDLAAKVDSLSKIVEKQTKLLGQTGQKLIELQIRDTKAAIGGKFDCKVSALDKDEFITNEDVVQLVGELQGQLDELEERSIRRTFNIQLDSSTGLISPLLNKEGDVPGSNFPKTVQEFSNMSRKQVIEYCVFYDVIVPEGSNGASAESADLITDEIVSEYSDQEIDQMHDELARFMGLRVRKCGGVW